MYSFQYHFWDEKHFPGFRNWMNELYHNTIQMYPGDRRNSKLLAQSYCQAVEYFYVSLIKLGYVKKSNFSSILKEIKRLQFFDKLEGNVNAYAMFDGGKIQVSPKLSTPLSKTMVLSHEMSHVINYRWIMDAQKFADSAYRIPSISKKLKALGLDSSDYIFCGFRLIDEVIAEEVGESVFYRLVQKNRPPKKERINTQIFGNKAYSTNFMIYGEFQEIAEKFCRQLSFLNKKSGNDVLKQLVIQSFSPDFFSKITTEALQCPEDIERIILMLACMGKLFRYTYGNVGLYNKEYHVDTYMRLFDRLCSSKDKYEIKGKHVFDKRI